ncbi:MAG TPA: peptidoglycan-binding domain-containing protein [Dongiaceae bacterium]|nr:peptidoglycan-binding domain-containing protein [Dongiaceae bacterium]
MPSAPKSRRKSPARRSDRSAPTLRAPAAAGGDAIVAIAVQHLREPYILGARAPLANPSWHGPWDCAEFAAWCLYRATGILFGTRPADDPMLADAYTGYWDEDARARGAVVEVDEAARVAGAFLLRLPARRVTGHIVISDGAGGTVEAHSQADGVVRLGLDDRRWDLGILVPGVRYFRQATPVEVTQPRGVLRLTTPLLRGDEVRAIQKLLTKLGYHPGAVDGVYGPQTASAVVQFQHDQGLVPDGEVGGRTRKALAL